MAASVVNATLNDIAFPNVHSGLTPVWKRVNIQTTSLDDIGDDVLLVKMPDVAYVRNVAGAVTYDVGTLDSHATPLLAFSLGWGDVDGVIDKTLKTGIDEDDLGESATIAGEKTWYDVGGLYLIMSVTAAAATAAAGDVEVAFEYSSSVRELYDDGA
jgi:hypothetical protein